MVDTYRLLSQVRLAKYSDISDEELALLYQKTCDQSILAEVFCRNFKLWCSLVYSTRFYKVEKETLISECLSCLDRVLKVFDTKKKTRFTTFATYDMTCAFLTHAYKANREKADQLLSLEQMVEQTDSNPYEMNFVKPVDNEFLGVELSTLLEQAGLSEKELILCKAIIDDPYIKNNELAEKLKVHRHTVRSLKASVGMKLQPALVR